MAPLTYKQQLFVSFYLGEAEGNASEAARMAGYALPDKSGSRLVGKSRIRAAIDAKLDEVALTSNEILARLSGHATADIGDFLKFSGGSYILDLDKARKRGKLHLIKKLRPTKFGTAIELHDSQAALVHLGKYRGLFKDQPESIEDPVPISDQLSAALREAYGDKSSPPDEVPGGNP